MDHLELVRALLSELDYVRTTGQIADSLKNSAELCDDAARALGFVGFASFQAADDAPDYDDDGNLRAGVDN